MSSSDDSDDDRVKAACRRAYEYLPQDVEAWRRSIFNPYARQHFCHEHALSR